MPKKTPVYDAKQFVEDLREMEYEPFSYSGRAMYGSRCVAITVDLNQSDQTVGPLLGVRLAQLWMDHGATDLDALEHFLGRYDQRSDNMGLGYVIYWPEMTWPADVEEDEEEE